MRRLAGILTAVVLASALTVVPVSAAPSVGELQQQKDAKQQEVNNLKDQYTSLMNKIDDLEGQLTKKGEEVIKVKAQLQAAKATQEKQYQDMLLRIKYIYEHGGDAGMLNSFLESKNFTEILEKSEYVTSVHQYDRKMLKEYQNTTEQVQRLDTSLEADMAKLETLQKDFGSQKDKVDVMLNDAQSQVNSLDGALKEAVEAAEKERKAAAEKARQEAAAKAAQSDSHTAISEKKASKKTAPTAKYQGQGNTGAAKAIVAAAYSQLGVPYVWGGSEPGAALDCSGLVNYCYACAGISIPRQSSQIEAYGTEVSDPQPGDICWHPGHVAIYIGNGKMIEAQQTGTNVMISNVRVTKYIRCW